MSWETHGRQYHAWFGHGTAEADGEPHELSAAEIASIVAAGAAASLSGGEKAGFQQYLSNGGLKALSEAIPIWAAASKLGDDEFRRIVAGAGLPEAGTAALHDVGRLVAGARGVDDLRAASGRLAAAVRAGGTEWQYGLSYARDAAVYAAQNGFLPMGGDGSGGTVFSVAAGSSVGAAAEVATDAGLVGAGRAVLGLLGPWGRLAAVALGLGAAGYLAWRRAHGDAANSPIVVESKPPSDAKDPEGAKAPGKPGSEQGFEDPKGGEEWVRESNENCFGWRHRDGSVWVPTGHRGIAHGGPHWDVQYPNGDHRNEFPPERD